MIVGIIGGVGSGKSITVVKEIIDKGKPCFVNFDVKCKNKNIIRLKTSDVVSIDEEVSPRGKKTYKYSVNWEFWKKAQQKFPQGFDIYIDEIHNIINSRRAMTKFNQFFNQWLAQIRKIFGQQENNNLYMISQRISGIDIGSRELVDTIIFTTAIKHFYTDKKTGARYKVLDNKKRQIVDVMKHYFIGEECLNAFMDFKYNGSKTYTGRSLFRANKYFDYYNSYQIIEFGNDLYL